MSSTLRLDERVPVVRLALRHECPARARGRAASTPRGRVVAEALERAADERRRAAGARATTGPSAHVEHDAVLVASARRTSSSSADRVLERSWPASPRSSLDGSIDDPRSSTSGTRRGAHVVAASAVGDRLRRPRRLDSTADPGERARGVRGTAEGRAAVSRRDSNEQECYIAALRLAEAATTTSGRCRPRPRSRRGGRSGRERPSASRSRGGGWTEREPRGNKWPTDDGGTAPSDVPDVLAPGLRVVFFGINPGACPPRARAPLRQPAQRLLASPARGRA